mgnify:CR=1 FL=1
MKFFEMTLGLAALMQGTDAWSGPAHLLTARVAYETLLKRNPDTVSQVENILSGLKREGTCPDKIAALIVEGKHSFVECATFADNIKYHGGGW